MATIQWFIDFFTAVYTNFRRSYYTYVHTSQNAQYFLWVTCLLKVPSQQVPYFFDMMAAAGGQNPDGHLPENLSAYYLRERPVFLFSDVISNIINFQSYSLTPGDVIIKLTIYTPAGYKDVFIRADASQMDISSYGFALEVMATMANKVLPLNNQLQTTLTKLQDYYNDKFNALRVSGLSADDRATIIQRANSVGQALLDLRNLSPYTIKICDTCGGTYPDNNDLQFFPNTIAVIGAVAWSRYTQISGDTAYMQQLQSQLLQIESLMNDTPKTLPPVTVTAGVKDTPWLLIAAVGAGVYFLSKNEKGKK